MTDHSMDTPNVDTHPLEAPASPGSSSPRRPRRERRVMPDEPTMHESIKRLAAGLVDKAVGRSVQCHCAGACLCDACADHRTDGLADRAAEQGRQINATSPYGRRSAE